MTVLPNMGLTLPVRGAPGSGVWGDTLDANSALTDAHDHSPGKGARIPTAGIGINADLSFASLYAAKDLQRITFASVAALAANNKSLFVNVADNELYWRNNVGTNVKMTLNNALNVAAFVGGIGGDYSAVSATEAFDDANKRYTFKDGGANWARLQSGEVRLVETGTAEVVYVGLAAPAALAASYTMTMPLALPGSTLLVQMDSTGAITTSNTVTGLITASAGVTASANQHVTVSGTGIYKHGDRSLFISAAAFNGGTGTTFAYAGNGSTGSNWVLPNTPANGLTGPVQLEVGKRIKTITFFFDKNGQAQGTTFRLIKSDASAGTRTVLSTVTDSTSAVSRISTSISPSYTVEDGFLIEIDIDQSTIGSGNSVLFYGAKIVYDQP